MKIQAIVIAVLMSISATNADCSSGEGALPALRCKYSAKRPTIDANLNDWRGVPGLNTELYTRYSEAEYPEGKASIKCTHDNSNIYFAFSIPGLYNFDAGDNHYCGAIGTMFKVGADATFTDMGGCPDAVESCPADLSVCESYLVDIGVHWELRTTQQNTLYSLNVADGSGNDLVANKDDEYAYSSYCRKDDDGANAGSEWSGAWKHTNPTIGEDGTYIFEMSRPLTTLSLTTDVQLRTGGTYKFGFAWWDPYETEGGWSDAGHYLTGCGTEFIDLKILKKPKKKKAGKNP